MPLGEIILTRVEVVVERTREGIALISNKLGSDLATRAERRGKAGHTSPQQMEGSMPISLKKDDSQPLPLGMECRKRRDITALGTE